MDKHRRDFLRGSLVVAGWAGWTALQGGAPAWAAEDEEAAGSAEKAFWRAVSIGDAAGVREQLDRHPELIRARDPLGRSGFAVALLGRHATVAALLRERGHEPDLHEAALALDWDRFAALADADPATVNRDHPIGGTAMFAAAVGGAGNQIWRVYSGGGEPNRVPRGDQGFTALRAALDHPDLEVAELTAASLLANGARPDGPQAGNSRPLHAAARRGSDPIVEILIRKGASVGATDARGRTAEEIARQAGHHSTVRLLEEHAKVPRDHSTSRRRYDVDGKRYVAPDLSKIPASERSALVGTAHRDLDAVRQAVERQPLLAHAVATTTEGAVEAGAHMGRVDIVDCLLDHGAPYSLPTALMRGDGSGARAMLEADALRIHERGAHDFPMLWYPVIGGGNPEMAQLLFEYGAQVERQHWLGTTALHFAAIAGNVDIAALLIEHGADVNRAGRKFGGRPLTPVELAEGREHTGVVKLLKEKGARG